MAPTRRILVAAELEDSHADAIIRGLEESPSVECHRVSLTDYSLERYQSLEPGADALFRAFGGAHASCSAPYDVVWYRRPGSIPLPASDHPDFEYLERVYSDYKRTLWMYLEFGAAADALWINRPTAHLAASAKPLQLHVARTLGFRVPDTLISNRPEDIRSFCQRHSNVICKSLTPHTWKEGAFLYQLLTARFDHREFTDASLALQPMIYQEEIPKLSEIRAVLFGKRVFAIELDSQALPQTQVDWRSVPDLAGYSTKYDLPEGVEQAMLRMAEKLGLAYCTFDLIRLTDGQFVFLEINEAGQFLFMEQWIPELPLLDAFCHYLAHGDLINWSINGDVLRLEELELQ